MSAIPGISTPQKKTSLKISTRLKFTLLTIINVTCFFILWELVATYSGVTNLFLPKFSDVMKDIPEMMAEGILLPNLLVSLVNFTVGLLIGIAIGLPLGFATGALRTLDRILSPYQWALFSMPRVILIPLIFLWFGITNNARLAIVAISVFPQLSVVVMEGVRTTNTTLLKVARSFGATRWKLFRSVLIPSSVPFIGTGIRMGMLRGLIGLFVGELFITNNGLGSIIGYARARFDTERMFACLFIFVGFSIIAMAATRFFETRLYKWRAVPEL